MPRKIKPGVFSSVWTEPEDGGMTPETFIGTCRLNRPLLGYHVFVNGPRSLQFQ
jgi:hypothetical protein